MSEIECGRMLNLHGFELLQGPGAESTGGSDGPGVVDRGRAVQSRKNQSRGIGAGREKVGVNIGSV